MIVVTKDLYTLRSWEGQDTESLTLQYRFCERNGCGTFQCGSRLLDQ